MWREPRTEWECTFRLWRIVLLQFGAMLLGAVGMIGIMMSVPFLVFTPTQQADEFADRMDRWVEERSARLDSLEAELDRLVAWRERNRRA